MSAPSSTPQLQSIGDTKGVVGVAPAEIDVSCRAPVGVLFLNGAVWLVLGSLLGFIGSMNFHKASLFANCAWLSYGRVHPAALNALVYGAAMQAGLGVMLWLICHLGRTRLAAPLLTMAGCKIWNLGVTLGVIGILAGDSTGFEWLEMPRYGSGFLFFGYLCIGISGALTFRYRAEQGFYISQWFLLAALFWFPWIYSSAEMLLVWRPVRGTLQAVIDWWYINNLTTIWFGFVGLGTAFYFIPKLMNRPLYSHYLALFTFWLLVMFGSWGGIPPGAPVPPWLPALSTFASVVCIVAYLAVALNVQQSSCGERPASGGISFGFISFGMVAYVVASLMGSFSSVWRFSKVLNFTWFLPAQQELFVYGFFAMVMFGAVYCIVPRLLGMELPKPGLVNGHFWLSTFGVALYVLALAIGGIKQGLAMNDAGIAFLDVMKGTLLFIQASSLGELAMLVGNVLLLVNLMLLVVRMSRACLSSAVAANVPAKGVAA